VTPTAAGKLAAKTQVVALVTQALAEGNSALQTVISGPLAIATHPAHAVKAELTRGKMSASAVNTITVRNQP